MASLLIVESGVALIRPGVTRVEIREEVGRSRVPTGTKPEPPAHEAHPPAREETP